MNDSANVAVKAVDYVEVAFKQRTEDRPCERLAFDSNPFLPQGGLLPFGRNRKLNAV